MVLESFQVSEETIKNRTRGRYLYVLMIPIFAIGSSLFTPLALTTLKSIWFFGILLGICLVGSVALFLTTPRFIKKNLAALKVTFEKNGFAYNGQKHQSFIAYQDITKLRINATRSDKVVQIRVSTKSKSLTIHSIDNLDQVAANILSHVPETVEVKRKVVWLDPTKPTMTILSMVIGFVLLNTIYQYFELNFIILSLFNICAGLYLIIFRPSYRSHYSENPKTDYTSGVMFLILGLGILAIYVMGNGTAVLTHPCSFIGKYIDNSGCIHSFERGETIAFLPDDQTLAHTTFSSIPFSPLSGWVGFWTPVLQHKGNLESFILSKDGNTLMSWTNHNYDEEKLWFWDTDTQELLNTQIIPEQYTNANLAITSDGQKIALHNSTPDGSRIEIWQTQPWEIQQTIAGSGPLAFSPDDQSIVGTQGGREFAIWDISSGDKIVTMETSEDYGFHINDFAFSPDSQLLAGLDSDSTIYLWQTLDGKLLQVVQVIHEHQIKPSNQLIYSPDGNWLISGYEDRDINYSYLTVWNTQTDTLTIQKDLRLGERYTRAPKSFSFTSDGQILAVGTNDGAYVFDFEQLIQ